VKLFWLACASLFFLPLGLTPSDGQSLLMRGIGSVSGLFCAVLIYRMGVLWKSELVGLLAASVLSTSLGFFALIQKPGPTLFMFLGMAVALDISLRLLLGHGQKKMQKALTVMGVAFTAALASRHIWPSVETPVFPSLPHAVVLGFLPWAIILPKVLLRWSKEHGLSLRRDEGGAFLLGVCAFSLGLGWPALLPLSLVVAAVWEEEWETEPAPFWVQTALVGLGGVALAALILLKWPTINPSALTTHGGLLGVTLSVCVLLLAGVWGMRKTAIAFGGIVIAAVLLLGSLATLSSLLHAQEPSQNLLPPGTAPTSSGPIDPESPVEFSNAPVLEPPPRVRLPDVRVRKDQWKGPRSAVTQERQAVFRHAEAWERFWKNGLVPYAPQWAQVPGVDFTRDMVIGVFLGERADPHYDIDVVSVKVVRRGNGGETLLVKYREPVRMQGVFSPPFAVQPFHLRRVPVFTGPIAFEKVQR